MSTNPIQPMTLCVIRDEDRVLLAMKKRGFGKGNWNGYGGKLNQGESTEDALIREVKEESTLDLLEYEKRGEIFFHFPDITHHVHIYEGTMYAGIPQETEEMKPQWFDIKNIPYDTMWPDDKEWYPYFLNKILFVGNVSFSADYKIISIEIKKV
jgi:8-oxo-dGTP pyrophosphatase MutT (NUDIX family)